MAFQFQEGATYNVRDLIEVPIAEMKASPEAVSIRLVFDDGHVESTSRECIHGRYCWELYKIYPYQVVSRKHHLNAYRRRLTGDTTDKILNDIQWACVFECQKHGIFPSLEASCEKIYDIVDMLDAHYHDIREFAVFIDGMDFIRLRQHPEVKKVNDGLRDKEFVVPADIGISYSTLKRVIDRDPKHQHDSLVMGGRSSSIKVPSLNKCICPQGFITDVDSVMFRKPVLDSFTTGITSIRDLIMESRTAAMSIFYQKHAMQQSEYLTRMLQLAAECVYRVHKGDCGSRKYMEVPIREMNDLEDMVGIWHLDPETGNEVPITKRHIHLIGSIVRVRSVLNCQVNDRYGVCSKCYGQLADSLFPTDNIGHIGATVLQRIITQSILSNKHLVASAEGELIRMSSDDQNFLKPQLDDVTEFYLNPRLKRKRVTMSFAAADAVRLQDLMFLEDLDSASPMRLTQLETLTFRIYDGETLVVEYPVLVSSPSQKSFFTIPMLRYIREHGWGVDHNGQYEVSLDKWNFDTNVSVVGVPMVQYSTPAHMMAIKEMLTTSTEIGKENKYSISKFPNPTAALLAFHDLVKLRLNVNFTHMQTIVLTYLCADPSNFDYRIPKLKSAGQLMPYNDIMVTRDIALAMSYQKHFDTFKSMRTYVIDQRHPHPHSNAMRG